ncbi:hypothetical protein LIER_12255 [Lithospermum erythrorhizon]|uniref:Retrotransposon gag domain-containing protein n=1 Tax=Lithospermum erythrorhizon TaxID=34254 RepID=A0AAV3PSS3_LITER
MTILSTNPDIYAKAVSNSLTDKALEWYMTLPLKSIDTYPQTTDTFIAKFGSPIQRSKIWEVEKCTLLETPLSKDQWIARVKQYVELAELKTKETEDKGDQQDIPPQNRRSPQRDNYPRTKNEQPEALPLTGRIDTIARGKAGGGDSRNSRKIYAHREMYSIVETTTKKEEVITFNDKDLVGIEVPHDDSVVIALVIANFKVERILVDTGSSVDVVYLSTFDKWRLPRSLIKLLHTPLTGFTGHTIQVVSELTLDFTVAERARISIIRAQFTVVDLEDSSYNGLIGRPILTALRATVSPIYLKLKFPTPRGIGEICGDQNKARIFFIKPRFPHWVRVKANRGKSGAEKSHGGE